MNVPVKHPKPLMISEELRMHHQAFAKRHFKLLNNSTENRKPLNRKKSLNDEHQSPQIIQQNYKKNIERWLNSFSSSELIKVFLIENNLFCSIIKQMFNIVAKEGSGSSYKFQMRQESEILLSGIGNISNKLTKNDPNIDDLFKHEIFNSDDYIDHRFEDEIIKNIKIFDLHDKMDAVTFSEKFLENNNFYKSFELFSSNNVFSSCCKVIYDQKNYIFNFPDWYKVDQYHSIFEFIVANFERTICQKYLISQEKNKFPQMLLSFVDERKLNDCFENRERVIKFMIEEYPNKSEKFFLDLDLNKLINSIKSLQENIITASKSLNDIERQINTEDNAYMILQLKELYFKLNQKDFVDELIFNNFEKSPLVYLFCKKIFDNLLDLLSKKNAKDLLNDDELTSNNSKKNKNAKKKNSIYQKSDNKVKEVKSLDNNTNLKTEKNQDINNNVLNTNDLKKVDLFEGLTVINKNQFENQNNIKSIENKCNNENIQIIETKISQIKIEALREDLDYHVKSLVPYIKLNDENFNSSELNDTDSQYTSTHFSDNRSIIFNFNKHIMKKSPSFDRILQKDNSKIKERKSVPPLSRNEEEVKKEEACEKKEEEKMRINLEEIVETNFNSVDSNDNTLSSQQNMKKNKKKRQQKFKKQKSNNQVIEAKKFVQTKNTDMKNQRKSESHSENIEKVNYSNSNNKIEIVKNDQNKDNDKEHLITEKIEEICNPNLIEYEINDINPILISFRNSFNQSRMYNDNLVNYKNNKNYNKFNKTNNTSYYLPHSLKQNNTRLNHNFLNKNQTAITHNPSFIPKDNYYNNQFYYNFFFPNNQFYIKDNLIQSQLNEETKIYSNAITNFNAYIREIKDFSISFLEDLLSKSLNIDVQLDIYGSFATDLSIECSDIDLSIRISDLITDKIEFILYITKILSEKRIFESIIPITTASVPIIKLIIDPLKILNKDSHLFKKFDEMKNMDFYKNYRYRKEEISKIRIDLSILDIDDISMNVEWVKQQEIIYPEIKMLIHVLKRYLQLNSLNCSFDGGLSSYSLILLIVAFLKYINHQIDNYGKILFDFFKFYGNTFDFTTSYIDVSQNNPFICLNSVMDKYPCILDPITKKNVAKNSFRINDVKYSFCLAFDKLCKHNINYNLNEGMSILNDILLNSYYLS